MQPASRIVIGTVLFFLIIGAGFAVGFYFNFKHNAPPAGNNSLTEFNEALPKPNHKTYTASPPSIGVFAKMFALDTLPAGNAMPSVTVDAQKAADVKTGQKILFFDADNKQLNLIGEVLGITQLPSPDKISILMGIQAPDTNQLTFIDHAEVTLASQSSVSRLPKAAIVQDKDGNTFAWEINEGSDGAMHAYQKGVRVLDTMRDIVAIEPFIGTSNVFVLDPDKNLQDGQAINVQRILYAGPERPDSEIVARQIQEVSDENSSKAIAAWQQALKPKNTGAGCAPPANAADKFINEIKAISGVLASPPQASSAPAVAPAPLLPSSLPAPAVASP